VKEIKSNKKCAKCGAAFTCKSVDGSCWCMNYQLTKEQLDYLKGIGCDEYQGYYYSKPLPASELEKLYLFLS